jgi:metal-responsive CopG/Arc/MetJ family transcriptional regulator
MPGKGTPRHAIRIPDALWAEFQAATHAAGTNPSETIRQLIRDWLNTHKQRGTK